MPISADSSRILARVPARSQGGFTLLEVMAAVAVVGVCILPILEARGQANGRAYRASCMLTAMHHAEQILVRCMATAEEYERYQAPVDDDPDFQYELTLEEFDVSTGLTPDEEQDEAEADMEDFGEALPSDASVQDGEDEERDNPHRMRRFRVRVTWPSWDAGDEESDSVLLEGYLPRVWERVESEEDEG